MPKKQHSHLAAIPDPMDEELEAELREMRKLAAHADRIRLRQQQGLVTEDQNKIAVTIAWIFGFSAGVTTGISLICWFTYAWQAWPVYAASAGLWSVCGWAAHRCWLWAGQ